MQSAMSELKEHSPPSMKPPGDLREDLREELREDSQEIEMPQGEAPRGRLKRRRQSTHSPPRAKSPSRGHDRESGSRYRHHYRKHRRAHSLLRSTTGSITPQTPQTPADIAAMSENRRRRSDVQLDHTLRGRTRDRSPTTESDTDGKVSGKGQGSRRKRSQPPSRHQSSRATTEEVRRQRSLPNIYQEAYLDVKVG
jgi:hypothetical protein